MKRLLIKFIKKIRKNILIIVLFLVLGLCSGILIDNYQTEEYQSVSTLKFSDSEFILNHLNNNAYEIKTKVILEEVINNLSLSYSYDELSKMIKTNVIENSNLLEVIVINKDSKLSKSINEELVKVFLSSPDYIDTIIVEDSTTHVLEKDSHLIQITSISLLSSIILVAIFGQEDSSIKNHEELQKNLNIKSLGVVPRFHGDEDIKRKSKVKGNSSNIILLRNPNSIISESYRMIRTNLDFLDTKVISFTSTTACEGKSGTVANLALSFAYMGKKVLIIDCDLRKPSLHKMFEINRTLGLTDILVYNRINRIAEFTQTFKIPNTEFSLDIMAAGSKVSNPSELLNRDAFKVLIEETKNKYDIILIDCPPIGLISDAGIVGKVSDGTVYVVEYNKLNYNKIKNGLETLDSLKTTILGGVLTKVDLKKQKKLYGNKNDYYKEYI